MVGQARPNPHYLHGHHDWPTKRRFTLALALSGIKVIDTCGLGPASLAAMTMADMGAEVIKVDMPPGGGHKGVGDGLLYFPEKEDEAARMVAYAAVDRNKKKTAINMRTPAGQE